MFGYMTEKEASALGFTHHGSCFGIPIWITDTEMPMVATKLACLDSVMFFLLDVAVQLMQWLRPNEEAFFQFTLIKEIRKS